jgi:hypothetical protein
MNEINRTILLLGSSSKCIHGLDWKCLDYESRPPSKMDLRRKEGGVRLLIADTEIGVRGHARQPGASLEASGEMWSCRKGGGQYWVARRRRTAGQRLAVVEAVGRSLVKPPAWGIRLHLQATATVAENVGGDDT